MKKACIAYLMRCILGVVTTYKRLYMYVCMYVLIKPTQTGALIWVKFISRHTGTGKTSKHVVTYLLTW